MAPAADDPADDAADVARVDVDAATRAIADVALRTPTLTCDELDGACGCRVVLKCECFQRTGSFKLRGVLNKIAALGPRAAAGLVTASAGNHGRALAYAARARGLACDVFIPRDASVSKVAAIEALGASVHVDGDTVDEAIAAARAHAQANGAAFVHPFDDIDVIAGQGTIGLELLEQVDDLVRVVVPLGGGGLAAGIGSALARRGADVQLIGVQAAACAPFPASLEAREPTPVAAGATIADGIAIKRPGGLSLSLLRTLLDEVVLVSEDEIARGMAALVEHASVVAEGAGAAGVAALLAGRLAPAAGTTTVIVSGGNVDSGLLAAVLRRRETELGRRVRLFTRVPDRPGGLAGVIDLVAGERANLLSIEHLREGVSLHVRETGVELTLETRGPLHTERVVAALRAAGYEVALEQRADDER